MTLGIVNVLPALTAQSPWLVKDLLPGKDYFYEPKAHLSSKNCWNQYFLFLFFRDDKPYCAECFGELFSKRCTACSKPITGKSASAA